MTSLQILVLTMPFLLLALVLAVMGITRWQDKREAERNAR
jgi:hypothetical protein